MPQMLIGALTKSSPKSPRLSTDSALFARSTRNSSPGAGSVTTKENGMAAWKVMTASALALATVMAPAQAGPVTTSIAPLAVQSSDGNGVIQGRSRHRYGRHRHYRHRRGGNIGLGLGLGVIGGSIASEAYRSNAYGYGYDGGDPRAACAQRFRSFEWNTGLYTTYGGDRVLCPYLR
jgi:hypothetical protein